METQRFIITEHHPSPSIPPEQAIQRIITVWLTKELHK